MWRLIIIVLVAVAAAGCMGSTGRGSASSGHRQRSANVEAGRVPRTDMIISYSVPLADESTCPEVTTCALTHGLGKARMIIGRRLTCGPDAGDYVDPRAACRALDHIVASLAKKHWICSCITAAEYAEARGSYRHRRRTIPLDGCSLCNLPGVSADLAVLMPTAHG